MAAPRPPSADPPLETLDSSDIDETAPPVRSPLAALPFDPNQPRPPLAAAAPGQPAAFTGQRPPAVPGFASYGASPPGAASSRFGEETAPPERSPLAAALPFRHARPVASTMAIPMPSADDLRRMAQGGAAAAARATPANAARAKIEMAKTVAFAMPPESAVPSGGGAVAPASTDHFGLSIEQYAALCAEVAVFPRTAEAIFAKYGLAVKKDRLTADLAWQDRLRADNALMARWQSLYLRYHEHFFAAQRGAR